MFASSRRDHPGGGGQTEGVHRALTFIDAVGLILGIVGYTQAPQIEDQQQF